MRNVPVAAQRGKRARRPTSARALENPQIQKCAPLRAVVPGAPSGATVRGAGVAELAALALEGDRE